MICHVPCVRVHVSAIQIVRPSESTAGLPSGSTQVRGQDAASAASASGKIWNT